MLVPENEIADAIRTLMRLRIGASVNFFDLLEMGQLENINYFVKSKNSEGTCLWYIDDISLEEALAHFLRIRRERKLGFDYEGIEPNK